MIQKVQSRKSTEEAGAQNWLNMHRCESGQTLTVWLGAIVVMSSVLMGSAYDMSVAWMHKQWADTAAQAACTAGAMDMLYAANNDVPTTPVTAYNFLSSTSGDCATSSSNSMCYYAKLNGYASPGLTTNTSSNDVLWSMSTSAPANSNSPTLTTTPNGKPAYMKVVVTENVPVTFMGIFAHMLGLPNSWNTIQVVGHCNCGIESSGSAPVKTSSSGSASLGGCSYPDRYCLGMDVIFEPAGSTFSLTESSSGWESDSDAGGVTVSVNVSCDGGNTWDEIDGYDLNGGPESPSSGIGSELCTVGSSGQVRVQVLGSWDYGLFGDSATFSSDYSYTDTTTGSAYHATSF